MGRLDSSTWVGLALVLLGTFLLTGTLGVIPLQSPAIWSIAFALVGVAFLSAMVRGRGQWWPLIPGFIFLAIGILIGMDVVAPGVSRVWGGSLFLGLIGLAFAMVYIMQPSNWWAIIPAGTLLTLSAVALVDQGGGRGGGPVFLAGLGMTFLAVYFLARGGQGRMTWALIPAGILTALSLVAGLGGNPAFGILWPLLLVAAGLYLVYRAMEGRSAHE